MNRAPSYTSQVRPTKRLIFDLPWSTSKERSHSLGFVMRVLIDRISHEPLSERKSRRKARA